MFSDNSIFDIFENDMQCRLRRNHKQLLGDAN
jgi:hypothetical protein